MTRSLVPFKHWHLEWLEHKGQAYGGWVFLNLEQRKLLEQFSSWTGVADGKVIGCGGTVPYWPNRYAAWAYLNEVSAPHMRFITRCAKHALSLSPGRIEMTVRKDFVQGHRWAQMLGFEMETPEMKAYDPQGATHVGYVRFN